MRGEQARREALWFDRRPDGRIACLLCPHQCLIADGSHGICKVRVNRGGTMEIPFYGKISSVAVDPIEKKPLYHFHPGSQILSIGFVGCSFRCRFCQNWQISQSVDVATRLMSPEDVVETAQREHSFGIAYTYSEPLIHAEFVCDTARAARAAGLKNVLVSNGYMQPKPAEEILGLMDAANIDLKAFDDGFHRSETGGKLEEVKRFISQAAEAPTAAGARRVHLEVTTLVIPTKNDDPAQIEGIARFLAALNPQIPLHLSAYFPQYKYEVPPTSASSLKRLAEVARRHLQFVYIGNVGAEETNTACATCGNVLVRRRGYSVHVEGMSGGACKGCGTPAPIVTD